VKNYGWILLLAVVIPAAAQSKDNRASESWTVIRAGFLIDGKSDKPRHDQVIVIHGNRIESVGDAAAAKIPPGAAVIDLSKATVLPGLIDSHTHIFLQGEDPAQGGYDANILNAPLALRAARATVSARRALEQGFTTLRDVETEGAGYGDVGIKQAVCLSRLALSRLRAVIRLRAMLRNSTCLKAHRSSMARSRRARRRGSNSIMAPTGSRST
jgi:imidazolonepropionase-like amidohydrolase